MYATTAELEDNSYSNMEISIRKNISLTTAGKQGDVMKESVNYVKIAYRLLPEKVHPSLENENTQKSFVTYSHTRSSNTKRWSCGANIAIYSVLMNKKVNKLL